MSVSSPRAKVVLYSRQSIDHAEGVARQLERCRTLAASRGWAVWQEYTEAASASKGVRPQFQRVLGSGADVVVCVDLDRLLRSQKDLLALLDAGIRVVTVDGELDLASADGEFRATMLAALARFEVRRKGERQVRANESRVSKGLPVPGKRRFGYLPGNVTEHPVEGPEVLQLFERVRNGEAIFKLAKELGKRTVVVRGILTNRSYAGWVRRQGVWYPAAPEVDRLVSQELFDEVQAVLVDPSRKTSPGAQVRYLASGLARCGVCGRPLNSRAGNYLCTEDLAHPCIKKSTLDEVLCWAVFDYLNAEVEVSGGLPDAERGLSALVAERAELTADLVTPGVDKAVVRAALSALAERIREAEETVSALRAEHVAADVVSEMREALRSDMTDQEGAQWWEEKWAGLGLTAQRELVRALHVQVNPGRGPERIRIQHRGE